MIPLSKSYIAIARSYSASVAMTRRLSSGTFKKESALRIGPFRSLQRLALRGSVLATLAAERRIEPPHRFAAGAGAAAAPLQRTRPNSTPL